MKHRHIAYHFNGNFMENHNMIFIFYFFAKFNHWNIGGFMYMTSELSEYGVCHATFKSTQF